MKRLFLILTLFNLFYASAQNNVRIFSGQGELFTVSVFDSIQNKIPQTSVLITSIYEDTLQIKLEFENKTKFETTLFIYDKGKPTTNKEFNYKITREGSKVKLSYVGYYDIKKLPNPLVPEKPIIDTTTKYKNTRLGHFCELKDGKPIYFNNIPKDEICKTGMVAEYLNYTNLLMVKAQVVDDKFIVAENVCRNNCLTVSQLNFILNYIDFELDKLKLIKLAYFNLVDIANKKDLEKSFRFESSVTELNSFLKTAPDSKIKSSTICKNASSQEEIKALANKLGAYENDSQKFDVFKKSYGEYCYTKDQVVTILTLFIHDREKFDAAKLLYFRCIEKGSFLEISEVFSYNETISGLKDFVAKQKG
ncbi:MAG: DUF4476 domain-containing protein [Bacteroidota bacterium]|nr:DUF4476 domain-containing protein [Bacteroidota bacterium]MDP3144470.1 DUF4476 domain-containing protein [Bacteroidota bacterium]